MTTKKYSLYVIIRIQEKNIKTFFTKTKTFTNKHQILYIKRLDCYTLQ